MILLFSWVGPTLPELPIDHPLTPYALYMIRVATLTYHMMWLWLVAKILLVTAIVVAILRVNKLTARVERMTEKTEAAVERAEKAEKAAVDEREVVKQLLSVIKGWTILREAVESKALEKVQQASQDIKDEVAKVPAATAEATAIRIMSGATEPPKTDSGSHKKPPLPPSGA